MGELGEQMPKCLIEYNGETIIQRNLKILNNCGIQDITIVVGYRREQIINRININFPDKYINYIVNLDYLKKENIYSVWVSRNSFNNDILMMDADLIFNANVIKRIIRYKKKNFIVVRKETHEDEMIVLIKNRRIISLSNNQSINNLDFDYKAESVGIIRFSKYAAKEFIDKIRLFVSHGDLNKYYEEAINLLLEKFKFWVLELDKNSVVEEIDTMDDIERLKSYLNRSINSSVF